MKKPFFLFVAVTAVLVVSCTKETPPTLNRTTIHNTTATDATSNQKPILKVRNAQNASNHSAYRNSRKRIVSK